MGTKQELIKELDEILKLTTEQNFHYQRGVQYLYDGLAWVYVWWTKASKEKGLLEELYAANNIVGKAAENEEKFTRILRLTWRLDWADSSKAKLQQWSNVLRVLHDEVKRNGDAYKIDPKKRLAQFIETSGGIRKLIGADKYDPVSSNIEQKAKGKVGRSEEDAAEIAKRHLQLGELHFENARSISNIQTGKPIAVNRKGYALALIRAKANGTFDLLATVNDDTQIQDAIRKSYKRDTSNVPTVLQLITEIITTQSLPIALNKHRNALQDNAKFTDDKGEVVSVKQYRRLLFRKSHGDILLSENRTGCSVVTLVYPHEPILNSSSDVFMRVQDRRYIEEAIIQQQDLTIYGSNDENKVPAVRDTEIAASHRLVLENKVLKTKRALYFYAMGSLSGLSIPQADLKIDYEFTPVWTATIDKLFLEKLNVLFVGKWLTEFGHHITRATHKTIRFEFGKTNLLLKYFGENGNLTRTSNQFVVEKIGKASKPIKPVFLTKDILPVLQGLAHTDIQGNVKLAVNEDKLTIRYKTHLAEYHISIPTCSTSGKRTSTAFAGYGG